MKNKFLEYCSNNGFQQNNEQIKSLDLIISFYKQSGILKSKFLNFFTKKNKKLGFYLHGDVGVGKTMLLNFFFDNLKIAKQRSHFNEFMINFHDFRHNQKLQRKDNSIEAFVQILKKKINLIYLDEFQVNNIVDALILGKLFETIFEKKIIVLLSSNTRIEDLYKDGLQREQFLNFLNIIKKKCLQHELIIEQDYRKLSLSKIQRFFYPINAHNTFQANQVFRKLSKDKLKKTKKLNIKGRELIISNFYEGVARFDFDDLCSVNLGAEDYISLANNCRFIVIDQIPVFSDDNADKQNRFVTLVDILYEKKIPMMVSSNFSLENYKSSQKLSSIFKRTVSRLFELTSPKFSI